MKSIRLLLALIIPFYGCSKAHWDAEIVQCNSTDIINLDHPKSTSLQTIMDHYTNLGIPGIAMAICTNDGYWSGSAGYSKIETETLMQPCHLQYSQSVFKTYMAVAMLILYEQGRIDLDESITVYLPENVISKIANADKISIRMLLNHTSGLAEYNDNPSYITYLLQHPLHKFTTMDYLDYIDGKQLQYTPGTKYKYTNTNYVVLGLIADQITGDHARFISDEIFKPLELNNSFYHEDMNYLNKPELVNSYWDRYSNSTLENCSGMQKTNVSSLKGDDGMIASPMDYVKFLQALFDNQLLADSTLAQMMSFKQSEDDENYGYGLGIHKDIYKQKIEYGHSGDGIGAACYLSYFPHNNTYAFIAVNIGTAVPSPIFDNTSKLVDDIFDILIQ